MGIPKLLFALLLNLVVMPGAGQIFVKRKKRGYAFVVLVVGLLLAFTYSITLFFKAEMAGVTPTTDPNAILMLAQTLTANLWGKHEVAFRGYVFLLGTLYIVSEIDMILIYLDDKNGAA